MGAVGLAFTSYSVGLIAVAETRQLTVYAAASAMGVSMKSFTGHAEKFAAVWSGVSQTSSLPHPAGP